jgi:hypothetical protein
LLKSRSFAIESPVPLSIVQTIPFAEADLPGYASTEVRNVCGYVAGFSVASNHPAWQSAVSALGRFKEVVIIVLLRESVF